MITPLLVVYHSCSILKQYSRGLYLSNFIWGEGGPDLSRLPGQNYRREKEKLEKSKIGKKLRTGDGKKIQKIQDMVNNTIVTLITNGLFWRGRYKHFSRWFNGWLYDQNIDPPDAPAVFTLQGGSSPAVNLLSPQFTNGNATFGSESYLFGGQPVMASTFIVSPAAAFPAVLSPTAANNSSSFSSGSATLLQPSAASFNTRPSNFLGQRDVETIINHHASVKT